jgi:hypothetical protein
MERKLKKRGKNNFLSYLRRGIRRGLGIRLGDQTGN